MHRVYLCGQVTGLSYNEARYGWRADVAGALATLPGVEVLSPMRAKDEQHDIDSLDKHGIADSILAGPRGITTRDRWDVHRSTLLFANFVGMTKISVGGMIELGWADAWRVPILCCMEPGNIHEHAMVDELIGWRCHSLEEGIHVARSVLAGGL